MRGMHRFMLTATGHEQEIKEREMKNFILIDAAEGFAGVEKIGSNPVFGGLVPVTTRKARGKWFRQVNGSLARCTASQVLRGAIQLDDGDVSNCVSHAYDDASRCLCGDHKFICCESGGWNVEKIH